MKSTGRLISGRALAYSRAVHFVRELLTQDAGANPELLWPQAAAELRSAWTAEGGRRYAGGVTPDPL